MKNKIFIVSILFSLFISLFFSIKTINNLLKDTKNNTVNINDIVETTANNFPSSFDESISLSKKYNLDITIIDLDGNVLATSNKNMSQSVNYAIKNHDTILDIKKNKQLLYWNILIFISGLSSNILLTDSIDIAIYISASFQLIFNLGVYCITRFQLRKMKR